MKRRRFNRAVKFQGVCLFPVDLCKFKGSNMEGVCFLCGSDGKESTCNVGDLGLIPGCKGLLEEGMATHLTWRIPVDRGASLLGSSPWGSQRDKTD